MNQALIERYRCPERFVNFSLAGELSRDLGYFRFGRDTICYGQCASGFPTKRVTDDLYDALADVDVSANGRNELPFDPTQVIENLRRERYLREKNSRLAAALRNAYYLARPSLPVSLRRRIQRMYFRGWERRRFPHWPVDRTVEHLLEKLLLLALKAQSVDKIPFIWFWPRGAPSCAIITHDIEGAAGRKFCGRLMELDESFDIKASFEIVPEERYPVSKGFLDSIRDKGLEINVHDCNHDGFLFRSHEEFLRRAKRINQYAQDYGASGFRSGVMYRNPDWYEELNVSYDMSVPNVAHLDPQRGGCCTVMPFFIGKILELPTTTIQDYSLFHILRDYSVDLWKRQIAIIVDAHGLATFIIHPDYVMEKRAWQTYKALLEHLAGLRAAGKIWITLPGEVDQWWRQRSQMKLVWQGDRWQIEGPGKERARLAYAMAEGDRVVYEIEADSLGQDSGGQGNHTKVVVQ